MAYQISSEDIAGGIPGLISPLTEALSPDGKHLTFLFPDNTGKRQIYSLDVDKLEPVNGDKHMLYKLVDMEKKASDKLSLEEQLRRERMRLFTDGVATYEWVSKSQNNLQYLLIPLAGKLYLYLNNPDSSLSTYYMIYNGSLGAAIDPHLSPNGYFVACVINNELYLLDLTQNIQSNSFDTITPPKRITFVTDTNKALTCGVADYVAQEEMGRYEGFWWSPDSTKIIYCINDESMIPKYEILHQGKPDPKHNETHRYPFAGEQNPVVKLAIYNLQDHMNTDIPLEAIFDAHDPRFTYYQGLNGLKALEYYICRVGWWPDGSIMTQIENREQNLLQLSHIDSHTFQRIILLEETSKSWVNLHDMLIVLSTPLTNTTYSFLWASERSGYFQLYLYSYNKVANAVTNHSQELPIGGGGEWVVNKVLTVDETHNKVYFAGNAIDPTRNDIFVASYLPNGLSTLTCLLASDGWHNSNAFILNNKHILITDSFSNVSTPLQYHVHLYERDTLQLFYTKEIYNNMNIDSRLRSSPELKQSLIIPTIHSLFSSDGQVVLYYSLYLPTGVTPLNYQLLDQPLPGIVCVYGGPHVQRVQNNWSMTADLRAQKFAQQGFVVIRIDNRGSSNRGLAFESAIYHDMGNIEVQDQVTVVQFLVGQGLLDGSRVGMYGWSYGGYMSAMSLCRASETFACAVAGAPVTSWDGYDTHYTERYMGHPYPNTQGYSDSSVMNHVSKMKGKLMLVHGLIDENVHFRHTARLINALIDNRKRYQLVLFPCERHSPHKKADRIYMEDIIFDFFVECLQK